MTDRSAKVINVGARGSKLSLAQADSVLAKLRRAAPNYQFELKIIKTKGDTERHSPLTRLGGEGIFVKELEAALSAGEIDLAVHSAKDLPAKLPAGFLLAAVPERAPVEDVLISISGAGLNELPPRTRLATGSPRRRALVNMFRPDIQLVDVRGNIDTRLRKLKEGEFEAIILARAGLQRLGLEYHIVQILPPEEFLPAPGQGALAVETRTSDIEIIEIVSSIDSPSDHAALLAERSLLAALQAGCSIPVGAWARWRRGKLKMDAIVLDNRGQTAVRSSGEVDNEEEAEKLGKMLAQDLMASGAGELLSHEI